MLAQHGAKACVRCKRAVRKKRSCTCSRGVQFSGSQRWGRALAIALDHLQCHLVKTGVPTALPCTYSHTMTHGCAVHTAREPVCDGAVDVLKQAGALATTRLDHIHRHCMQLFKLPDKRTFQFRAALFLASVWVSIAVTHVMPGGRAIVRALALANTAYIMWMMCAYLWRRRERQQVSAAATRGTAAFLPHCCPPGVPDTVPAQARCG